MLKGIEALFHELVCGGESLFVRNSIGKLGVDNSAAVSLASGTVSANYRNRHLKVKATGITEAIERGEVKLDWLQGEYMLADLGTKSFQ